MSSILKGFSQSNLNGPKKKLVFGQDNSEHCSTTSVSNQNTIENKEIGNYDTIDALPHIDHYRNLFSITSPEPKSRPTLEALHETSNISTKFRLGSTIDLNNEISSTFVPQTDQPSQTEIKPKIEVVKFGWIVGVLVCLKIFNKYSIKNFVFL